MLYGLISSPFLNKLIIRVGEPHLILFSHHLITFVHSFSPFRNYRL